MNLSYASLYDGLGYNVEISESTGEIVSIQKRAANKGLGTEIMGGLGNLVGDMFAGSNGILGKFGGALKNNALSKAFNVETWVNSISGLIQENARGLVTTAMDVIDLIGDPEVAVQRKKLLGVYMQAMYGKMISEMGFGIEYDENGDLKLKDADLLTRGINAAKDIGEEVYTAYKTGGVNVMISEFADVGTSAMTKLAGAIGSIMDLVGDDPIVREMSGKYAGLYMQAYYANMISSMGFGVDFENDRLVSPGVGGIIDKAVALAEKVYTAASTMGVNLMIDEFANVAANATTKLAGAISSVMDLVGDNPIMREMSATYAGLYMQAYYANMIRDMGYEVDFENDKLKGQTLSLGGITSEILGGATTALTKVLQTLTSTMATFVSIEVLGSSELVKEMSARYAGLYMQAYFANMIKDMGYDIDFENDKLNGQAISLGSIVGDIASIGSSALTGIFQGITTTIGAIVSGDVLLNSPIVKEKAGTYAGLYMQAYFADMIRDMGYDVDFKNDKISGSIEQGEKKGLLGLFPSIGDIISDGAGAISKSIVSGVAAVVASSALLESDEVKSLAGTYAGLYIQVYFADMIKDMGYDVDVTTQTLIGPTKTDASTKGLLGLFPSIGDIISDGANAISQSIVSNVAAVMASEALVNSESVKEASNKYAPIYISAYWTSLIESMGFEVSVDNGNISFKSVATEREVRKGLFKTVGEWFTGDDTTKINSAITTEIKNNIGTIISDAVNNSSWNFITPYIGTFLSNYFESIDTSDSKWNWNNSDKQSFSSSISTFVNNNISSILNTAVSSVSSATIGRGISDFVAGYFDVLKNDMNSKPGNWVFNDTQRQEFSQSLMEAVSKSFTNGNLEAAVEVNSHDYTELLKNMKASIDTIRMDMGVVKVHVKDFAPDIKNISEKTGNPTYGNDVVGYEESFGYEESEPK